MRHYTTCVLLGTDGLWEFFSPQEAAERLTALVSEPSENASRYEPHPDGRDLTSLDIP